MSDFEKNTDMFRLVKNTRNYKLRLRITLIALFQKPKNTYNTFKYYYYYLNTLP